MITEFWNKDKVLIGLTGFLATICGLFLNIPTSPKGQAQFSLENIQVFWLVTLIISLVVLFIRFTKLLWGEEKKLGHKYDLPTTGIFTFILGYVLLWVTLNLANYALNLQTQSTAVLSIIIFFTVILGHYAFLAYIMEKYRQKISLFWQGAIYGYIISGMISIGVVVVTVFIFKRPFFSWNILFLFITLFLLSGGGMISSLKASSKARKELKNILQK
jgi:hypothetical protein